MEESKLNWFRVGIELTWFQKGRRISLIFVWGIEFDLVLVLGSKVTSFLCVGSKLTTCGPKLTCLECDEKLTYLLCGWWLSKLTWFWDAGSKSLGLVWASNWLGFCLGGRYWLEFSVGDRTWLDFSLGIGIDLFCARGSKTCFSIWIEIGLDFVWCSTANRYGVWTGRCVSCFLEDHSVTVDWIALWFLLSKQTKDARA